MSLRTFLAICVAVAAIIMLVPGSAAASGESVSVSASANPAQDLPVTITAQGVADGSHSLFVFVDRFGTPCMQTSPYDEQFATELSSKSGDSVPAGSFTRTYTYTPTQARTYTLCA